MTKESSKVNYFICCSDCKGQGKKRQKLRKKIRIRYKQELIDFERSKGKNPTPIKPRGHLSVCTNCNGSGLAKSYTPAKVDTNNYPNLAIIGGGIGGVALAVACYHRGIPFTLYERDSSFDSRSQGYGLTLQQANKAMSGFGINSLEKSLISTRHVVHKTDGKVIGEWGMRKWLETEKDSTPKKTNLHVSRQSLRLALLEQLGENKNIKWNHQFINFKENVQGIELSFYQNGTTITHKADLIVGADGIRSSVRELLIDNFTLPLQYLGCMVILGICKLSNLGKIESDLLDSTTVFQTVNGIERMYMMPYDFESIMWQFSFPLSEKKAKELTKKGTGALKNEAIKRTDWHTPIPQIISATDELLISGYPVYDRELLRPELLKNKQFSTLIGDAAHPMSPFKGQGANQALLDALSLAREITKNCRPNTNWKENGIRKSVLNKCESEMLKRTASKVIDSAAAAKFLHTNEVLREADEPRGRNLKRLEG
jgi:salicylate hydroxylase